MQIATFIQYIQQNKRRSILIALFVVVVLVLIYPLIDRFLISRNGPATMPWEAVQPVDTNLDVGTPLSDGQRVEMQRSTTATTTSSPNGSTMRAVRKELTATTTDPTLTPDMLQNLIDRQSAR